MGAGGAGREGSRLFALLLAALVACTAGQPAPEQCDAVGPRVLCGNTATTQASCEAQGCCWAGPLQKEAWQPDLYLPACFYPNNGASSYSIEDPPTVDPSGLDNFTLVQSEQTLSELGTDFAFPIASVEGVAVDIVRFKIFPDEDRWEVPGRFFAPGSILSGTNATNNLVLQNEPARFSVNVTDTPFGLAVLRGDTQAVTFDSRGQRLIFKDQYIEVSTALRTNSFLYGAGERASETTFITRNGYPYPLWNRDESPEVPMRNTYGHWPFVLVVEADGTAWGMFMLNTNAMDVVATPDKLTWRLTGGIPDLFVFIGPTPLDVLEQYTRVVGRPAMQPYWAFGFHQSSMAYKSVQNLTDVVTRYAGAGIPLEAVWSGPDYMDGGRLFTLDPFEFNRDAVKTFLDGLRANNQSWVPILTPGVKVDPDYAGYLEGLRRDAFMKGTDGGEYYGWVIGGGANFPDFGWSEQADIYWREQLEQFDFLASWDGLWLDMNEISNYCNGEPVCEMPNPSALVNQLDFPPSQCQLVCTDAQASGLSLPQLVTSNPPYWVANGLTADPLTTNTISTLVNHTGGALEYDAHALYGMLQARASLEAYRELKQRRPFVLTRSTYAGAGAYAAHWTGDNNSTWVNMQWSVPGVLAAGLAGIPMAGADICGFRGNATAELCARWIELGAWYPFARVSSDRDAPPQELYQWDTVTQAARSALGLRYRLLPLYYTLMQARAMESTVTGAPIMRPLFLNFPTDPNTLPINRQFMIGSGVLVAPALSENETGAVQGYVPAGLWFSLWNPSTIVDARNGGVTVNLPAPAGQAPAYQRGGVSLIQQGDAATPALLTSTVKDSAITATVALPQFIVDRNSTANANLTAQPLATDPVTSFGYLYNDDGGATPDTTPYCCNFLQFNTTITYDTTFDMHYGRVEMKFGQLGASARSLEECQNPNAPAVTYPGLRRIEVWGWQRRALNVTLQVGNSVVPVPSQQYSTDGEKLVIDLTGSEVIFQCPFAVTAGTFAWNSPPPPPPPPPPPLPPPPPFPSPPLPPPFPSPPQPPAPAPPPAQAPVVAPNVPGETPPAGTPTQPPEASPPGVALPNLLAEPPVA